jgi:hypothetical protein
MSMSPRHPVDPVDDRAEAPAAPASPSRRRFVRNVGLGAAALGAAAATGSALTGVASAQTTAATDPPDLSASDVALVQFLQSISLAGKDGLASAAKKPGLTSELAEEIRSFSRHHGTQATTLGTLLSEADNITAANPKLIAQLNGQITGAADQAALLAVLLEFEEQVSATMLQAMGDADSFVVSGPVGSALAVIGQQAAALGSASATPISDWLPAFGSTTGALTPAAYPAR